MADTIETMSKIVARNRLLAGFPYKDGEVLTEEMIMAIEIELVPGYIPRKGIVTAAVLNKYCEDNGAIYQAKN